MQVPVKVHECAGADAVEQVKLMWIEVWKWKEVRMWVLLRCGWNCGCSPRSGARQDHCLLCCTDNWAVAGLASDWDCGAVWVVGRGQGGGNFCACL